MSTHPDSPDPTAPDESVIEEVARKRLGLSRWDRPALYRETAEAATDVDLPFWTVLLLSGAIATLGLALDAAAVVIGAMLIAPLLAPLLGLSLALATGDGRLAVQTGVTICLGAAGVVVVAALLTMLLPFQEVTAEVAARTRPTTVDLGIAVFSGLAGAVVTVSRERRLSASIPGVAIAVALIPPLAVAGFGMGIGWRWELVRGSLLLFGANLGGIVLSGMGAFLLVGMHRDDVREAARRWHEESKLPGLAGRLCRTALFSRLRVFGSPRERVLMVAAFVAAVAVPLTLSLREVVREARVDRAVTRAATALQHGGQASILSRDVTLGHGASRVLFRVATREWIGDGERARIERMASAAAREPVTFVLQQLIASEEELAEQAAVPASPAPVADAAAELTAASPAATVDRLRGQFSDAFDELVLPDSVLLVGAEVLVGGGPARVWVAYVAPHRLPEEAEVMMARQVAGALGLDPAAVAAEAVGAFPRPVPIDSAGRVELVGLLDRFPEVRLVVVADSAVADSVRRNLVRAGAPEARIDSRPGSPARIDLTSE